MTWKHGSPNCAPALTGADTAPMPGKGITPHFEAGSVDCRQSLWKRSARLDQKIPDALRARDGQIFLCFGMLFSHRQRDSAQFGCSASQSDAIRCPWTMHPAKVIPSSIGRSSLQAVGDASMQNTRTS
jgi:hypothetical protein